MSKCQICKKKIYLFFKKNINHPLFPVVNLNCSLHCQLQGGGRVQQGQRRRGRGAEQRSLQR